MKKGLKKIVSTILATSMIFSCFAFSSISPVSAASSYITEQSGWFESAYVEWSSVPNATGFAAYVKGANEADSAYTQLDNELIRKYPTYFRADAVGLKAGSYVIKVVPYINGSLDESQAFVSDTLNVTNYDRSGFAFSSASKYKTGSGAYNDNGTLRDGAKVFYVTKDTAKTITADVQVDNKGKVQTFTGMQDIITAKQKGYDTTPFDFRVIGTINDSDMDRFDSSAEGLQIKGKSADSELNITIEGIGEDATFKGFGILMRNAGNVELRNFAIMLCMDDSVSLDTDNVNIWVHNLDLFYGSTGGASDQAKGDGTVDVKADSKFVTVSYNHLFDSGKSSLCGMTSESGPNYITYHHNWFDHSDSRHPRIRTMSVHVYNNYYDGNSKYGVGAAKDSNAFVESNYFENCKHPMLSSKQGSDIMENDKTGNPDFSAKGTFSGENGGVIKAFNNYIVGSDADKFNGGVEPVYYDATQTQTNGKATQFDAYLATTRDEKVPSSVKALVGGVTYSNFDTSIDLGVKESDITPVMDVPTVVKSSAGRMNGGDFANTDRDKYTALTDSKSYAVDTALKSDLEAYKTSLVSVGGNTSGGTVDTTVSTSTESTTEATTSDVKTTESTTVSTTEETTTEATTTAPAKNDWIYAKDVKATLPDGLDDGAKIADNVSVWNYGSTFKYKENALNFNNGEYTASEEFQIGKGNASVAAETAKGDTIDSNNIEKALIFKTTGKTDITLYAGIGSSGVENANIIIVDSTGKVVDAGTIVRPGGAGQDHTVPTLTIPAAGEYYLLQPGNLTSLNVAAIKMVSYGSDTTESTTEGTTEGTTEDTTTTPDPKPTVTIYGDADGNGVVDASDVAEIVQIVLKNTDLGDNKVYIDVNADGKIDSADAAMVLQKVLDSTYKMTCEK